MARAKIKRYIGSIIIMSAVVILAAGCATYPKQVTLPVPFKPGKFIMSSSIAMVMEYYGDHQLPDSISAAELRRRKQNSTDYLPSMLEVINGLGYDWQYERYLPDHHGFTRAMNSIRLSLSKQCPVLINLPIEQWGLTVVAIGYNDSAETITYLDPRLPKPGVVTCFYDIFESMWYNRRHYENRSMIVTWPKKK